MPGSFKNQPIVIRLFGPVQMHTEGQPPIHFRSNPQRALLAYIAVESIRPLDRELIHGLIWPNLGEAQARNNLRVTLSRLRRSLSGVGDFIRVSGSTIELNPDANIYVDANAFIDLVEASHRHRHPPEKDCTECIERYRQAAELVQGEFAEGLVLEENIPFMEWLVLKRERLHRQALELLYTLADYHLRRGELHRAHTYAHRQIELEPWREEAHRQLMSVFARSGQKSAALAQYRKCRQILEDEFGVEPSAETQALYARIQSARRRRDQDLPAAPAPLIGRKSELAHLIGTLADPDHRLVTLTGPGGIGKTRLALHTAENQAGAFLDGVVFVPLAGVRSPEYLLPALTDALGISSAGPGGFRARLLDYLREKELLLVLDSFEHLLEGTAQLGEILRRAPGVKMLVTSRARLNLPWEWLFEMDGLSCPEVDRDGAVESFGAVQLFVQSARRVERNFSLAKEKSQVVHTCRLLGGMPLAIELAAARVREYSCREIAERIQENLDFLETTMRDVSPRHRSLRAAFEHSWLLLSGEEQRVFRRLSIFRAGFDRGAAKAVAGASPDMLSSFVDKSLLNRTRPARDASPLRYDLHELIRQFAEEKLDEAPVSSGISEKEMLGELHCKYFADYLRRRDKFMRTGKALKALDEVGAEIENVRSAWRWAYEHDMGRKIGKMLFLMLHVYEIQGWFEEAEEAFRRSVESLERVLEKAEEPDPQTLSTLGMALFLQGWYSMRIARHEQAEALCHRGMAIAHRLKDLELEAYCLDGLGVIAQLVGDYEAGERYMTACQVVCEAIGFQWMRGGALVNLGRIAMTRGDYEKANRLTQESLAISKSSGDLWGIATRTFTLGEIAIRTGELAKAEAFLRECLAAHKELGQEWRMADAYTGLGKIAFRREDYARAEAYYQDSLRLVRETGNRDRMAQVLALLGETDLALGRQQAAGRHFQAALETAVQIQADPLILRALLGMAAMLAKGQKKQPAAELLAFVAHHPAAEQSAKEKAEKLLRNLEAELGAGVLASAVRRGEEKETVEHLNFLTEAGYFSRSQTL